MRSKLAGNIMRFIILVLVQALILNHVNFLGYINPYIYVLFILFLPMRLSQWQIIFLSFLLGLSIDFFEDSGGIHAAACLFAGYFRPAILRISYGLSYENQNVKFYKSPLSERLTYVSLLVFLHHFVLFVFTYFNFSHFSLMLKNTLFSGIFTILLLMLITSLLKRSTK